MQFVCVGLVVVDDYCGCVEVIKFDDGLGGVVFEELVGFEVEVWEY